jgi:hypothetical protein
MGNQGFGLSQFSETPIVTQGKMLFGQVKQAKSCLAESCLVWTWFSIHTETLIHVSNCQGFQVSNGETIVGLGEVGDQNHGPQIVNVFQHVPTPSSDWIDNFHPVSGPKFWDPGDLGR